MVSPLHNWKALDEKGWILDGEFWCSHLVPIRFPIASSDALNVFLKFPWVLNSNTLHVVYLPKLDINYIKDQMEVK
jgi:hypothetical protein